MRISGARAWTYSQLRKGTSKLVPLPNRPSIGVFSQPLRGIHHPGHEVTRKTNSVLGVAGVVSGARLNLVALFALDLELAVAAVKLGVVGRVADVVLAAQFGGDLVESVSQLLEVVANIDQPASGLVGEFFHFAFAAV